MTYKRVQLQFDPVKEPSLTKQSFKDECDINHIMLKYEKTNLLTHVNNSQGTYGDFTEISDYQDSLNRVLAAQQSFMELPAHVRKEFQNDPAQLLSFISDDKNYDKALALGLISQDKIKQKPSTSPVVSSPIEELNKK